MTLLPLLVVAHVAAATPGTPEVTRLRLVPPADLGLSPPAPWTVVAGPGASGTGATVAKLPYVRPVPIDPDAAWRWPRRWILLRFFRDLYQIAAEVPEWSGGDAGRFALFASVTGLLILPPAPLDLALHRAVIGVTGGRRYVWTPLGGAIVWASVWGPLAIRYLTGWLGGEPDRMESFSLAVEAMSVAQIYHVVPKLLIGREAPNEGDGSGVIKGPAWGWRYFPGGIPSGHAATMYAVIGVLTTYYDSVPLAIVLHALGILFCASMIVDDIHFLSDIVWGASMGYYVGVWVVHHRARRFAPPGERPAPPKGLFVLPTLDPTRGRYGLSVALRF